MKIIEHLPLLLSAFLGLFLGSYLAPGMPVYPTFPSESQLDLNEYIELHNYLVLGLASICLAFVACKLLKQSVFSAYIASTIAGLIFSILESFRIGALPGFHLLSILAYMVGLFAFLGLANLFQIIIELNGSTSENT